MVIVRVIQTLFAINLLFHFSGCSLSPRLNHRGKTASNCLTRCQQLCCGFNWKSFNGHFKFTHGNFFLANSKGWIFSALSKLMLLLVKICGRHGNVLSIFSFLNIAEYYPQFQICPSQIKTSGEPASFHGVFFGVVCSTSQTQTLSPPHFSCHEKMIFSKIKNTISCWMSALRSPTFFADQDK